MRTIRILLAGALVSAVLHMETGLCQPNPSVKINDDATTAMQIWPSVAINRFGYAVICWEDQRSGNREIYTQIFNEGGARVLGNFRVFDDPAHAIQSLPAAAIDDRGRFVIVWQEGSEAAADIRGRLFLANGRPATDPFRINDEAAGVIHVEPVVAMRADGFFMVCWADSRDDSKLDIYGQRFDVLGNPIGGNFRINSETANEQDDAVIAMNSSGECLVVWEDKRGGGPIEIFGQKVDAAGALVGGNFQINPSIEGSCWDPSVAMQDDGSFFVAWSHGIANEQVFGRAFDSLGVPAEQSVTVSSGVDASGSFHPHMSTAPAGRYFCVWTSMIDHESNLWTRELNANGEPQGNLFKISDAPDPSQLMYPAADVDGRGIGIAVWGDSRDDESDIRGAWFGPRMALDLIAGSGYNGIVPLSWSPIYGETETRTVEIYRSRDPVMNFEMIASLDLSTRPYPKRMLDWVDEGVTNDSAYYYVISCAGGSRFSEVVSATPSAAGHSLRSAWSGSPVLVDGIMNEDEWADAAGLSIGNTAASESITLFVKNDADSLFVGVDDPNDPRIDPANLFVFLFDEDNDGLWDPSGMVTEGAITLTPAGLGYTPYGGDYPESLHRGALEIPAGVMGAISANSGHVQYEMAVSLTASPLQEEAGETIGAAFWINDPNSRYPGRYGYAAEWPSGALWDAARTLGRLTLAEETAVSGRSGGIPESFQLGRNFPNPFNPATTIPFRVGEACRVTLKVYDVLGKEKAVVIDTRLDAGNHSVRFDASGLPSGIYLYEIQMGNFKAAGKMAVLE
jgi:hypothetical protein